MIPHVEFEQGLLELNPLELPVAGNDEHHGPTNDIVLAKQANFVLFEQNSVIDGHILMELHYCRFGVVMIELEQGKRLTARYLGDDGDGDLCVPLKGHGEDGKVVDPLLEVLGVLEDIVLHREIHTKTMLEPAR